MDFGRLLSRAFNITLHHRALWLFGFLLALTSGGGGNNFTYRFNAPAGAPGSTPGVPGVPAVSPEAVVAGGLVLILIGLLIAIVVIAVQNISRTALIGQADDVEQLGATTVRRGWGYGWSRFAWRNFLITLLVGIAVALIVFALALVFGGGFAALGLALGLFGTQGGQANVGAIIALVCLTLLCLLPLAVIIGGFINAWLNLAQRHVVLRDAGVFESLGEGWTLFRAHWTSLVGLVVILFVISIAWTVLTGLVAFVLGFGLAGVPGILVGLLTERTWAGVLAALPGLLLLIAALAALSTVWITFYETVWTLAYRELTGLGAPGMALQPVTAPIPPAPMPPAPMGE